MPAVILDLDGALIASQIQMILEAEHFYGVHFSFDMWTSFTSLFDFVVAQTNADPESVAKQLFSINVLKRGKPTAGSQKAVKRLVALGFTPVIATSRPEEERDGTLEQLSEHFGSLIDPENVFLRPSGVSTFDFKSDIIKRYYTLGVYDDSWEFMSDAACVPEFETVLLGLVDQNWNQRMPFAANQYRMRLGNWKLEDFGFDSFINRLKSLS